jgi:glycosyltransferase involved in cell wall biosynthesis
LSGRNSDITVIIPTLNEEKNVEIVLQKLRRLGFTNILVVDGNSRDRTVAVAKRLGAKVIYQNGKGKGDALRQAFSHHGLDGTMVAIMDADGSMNPEELFSFAEKLQNGADVVKGSRFIDHGGSQDLTLLRRIGNKILLSLVNILSGTEYTDLCYGYAVFRNSALQRLYPRLRSENFEIETEIFIKAKKLGLKVVEAPSVELRRKHGKSNLKAFTDGFRILGTIIREFIFED